MATTRTIIDVQEGKLTMTVLGETVKFKVFDVNKIPLVATIDECYYIDCLDSLVYEMFLQEKEEPMQEDAH